MELKRGVPVTLHDGTARGPGPTITAPIQLGFCQESMLNHRNVSSQSVIPMVII